ncbi:MAG: threonine--tRNA ligase [Acidobacteriota bacterium]
MLDKDIAHQAESLSPEAARLYRIRHSLAHVMAQAVLAEFPEAKLGIGPPIENGFYYDFDLPSPLTPERLPQIESRMRKIVKENQAFKRSELAPAAAVEKIAAMNQPYKIELAKELEVKGAPIISFYENGPFVDMCEGPHCAATGEIPQDAFKLDSIAGAYWRGSEKNKMLTRIYALAFPTKGELDAYLAARSLAQERDHKKLGRELELFHIDDEVGKGLILWLPHGTVLRDEVEALAKEFEFRYGYVRVATPHITKQGLYYKSGHLPYYQKDMFPPLRLAEKADGDASAAPAKEEVYYLKPMNCPHHHMIFRTRPRSYREMPLRLAEYGSVYRFEQSGELGGLLRVRGMTMNDAHIYCPKALLKQEIASILKMYREIYSVFEFDRYQMRLSLHDPARGEKYHDDEALWAESETTLQSAMDELELRYDVARDDAAFYGPKIDIQFKNLLGREETVSTIQLDYLAAKRFELSYVDEHGQEQPPVVIHRAPLSTHERIMAYLIEHYGGAFPAWMAPVQVRLLTIADDILPYADGLAEKLRERRIRAEVDHTPHSFNKKIRAGTLQKIPILLVIGKKEAAEGTVTVRRYKVKKQETMAFDAFVAAVEEEIRARRHVKPDEG